MHYICTMVQSESLAVKYNQFWDIYWILVYIRAPKSNCLQVEFPLMTVQSARVRKIV
jgi:hypothetical protein